MPKENSVETLEVKSQNLSVSYILAKLGGPTHYYRGNSASIKNKQLYIDGTLAVENDRREIDLAVVSPNSKARLDAVISTQMVSVRNLIDPDAQVYSLGLTGRR